jgi:hypothetical protein
MILIVLSLLPLLGSLAGAVHLLALTVSGALRTDLVDSLSSILGLVQLVVIVALLISLLSSVSRKFIWSRGPGQAPTEPAPTAD